MSSPVERSDAGAPRDRRNADDDAILARRQLAVVRVVMIVVLSAIAVVSIWLGVRGLLLKAELEAARTVALELEADLTGLDFESAETSFDELSEHVAAARSLTDDPAWRVVEAVPFLGRNLTVIREMSALAVDVTGASGGLLQVGRSLDPAELAPQDGAIPLRPIVDAIPQLTAAVADFERVGERADSIDLSWTAPQIASAHRQFTDVLDEARAALASADELLPLVPRLLGSEGLRTYVVMFQNNAELRSLGGTALSFAIVQLDHGAIQLVDSISAGFDHFSDTGESVVPVPDGFEELYPGAFGQFIANATVRPSFTSAADVVAANWRRQFGTDIDGVVSVDVIALAYILQATGPVQLATGDVLETGSAASLLVNEVYQRYTSGNDRADNLAQDAFYESAVSETFAKLAGGSFDPAVLVASLLQGMEERRLAFWDARPEEQEVLVRNGVVTDGLPASTAEHDAVGVYLNDHVGSKLNFYLTSTVATASAICTPDGRQVHRVELGLGSVLTAEHAAGLSRFIAGTTYAALGIGKGDQRLVLLFYAPPGATVLRATIDGVDVPVASLHDTDRPVQKVVVNLVPGGVLTVRVDMLMAAPGDRSLDLDVTPTVRGTPVTAGPLDCTTVAVPEG